MMLHLNKQNKLPIFIALALLLVPVMPVASAAQGGELEAVIVHTTGSLSDLIALIESVGGQVKQRYQNLNAVAAELPPGALDGIQGIDEISVTKDGLISAPGALEVFRRTSGQTTLGGVDATAFDTNSIRAGESKLLGNVPIDLSAFAQSNPGAYVMNHSADNVLALHAGAEKSGKSNDSNKDDDDGDGDDDGDDNDDDGDDDHESERPPLSGEGVIVAVLDTGLHPGFGHFDTSGFVEGNLFLGLPHTPSPTVIGCDDLVGLIIPDTRGCMNLDNDGHGTMVSGIIAAGATFEFDPGIDTFANSVLSHAPTAALDLDSDTLPEVAMIGSAPDAQIYMIKVFLDSTTPTPSSVVVAAIDHIINLKNTGTVDIQVVNLSLGTSTLFAGQTELEQRVTAALLDAGIVPVASAGNAGPALLTTASPASAYSSVAVGAGSLAHQERVAADVFFCDFFFGGPLNCVDPSGLPQFVGFPVGDSLRPSTPGQTAWFSSRGPHADGRTDPAVMSDGLGVYGAGLGSAAGMVSLGNGTSFSAPNVAGIAALLREAFPGASATQIRNAIVESGNSRIIDGADEFDEGNGWVDALEAYELLEEGDVSDRLPRPPRTSPLVSQNIDQRVRSGNVRQRIDNLDPGEREDILYEVLPLTGELEIVVSGLSINTRRQCTPNQFFGDEIRLAVHTAKTSALSPIGDYYNINNPDPGSGFRHAFIGLGDLDGTNPSGVLPGACGNGECRFTLPDSEPGTLCANVGETPA